MKKNFCLSSVTSRSDDGRSFHPGAPKTHGAFHGWILKRSISIRWDKMDFLKLLKTMTSDSITFNKTERQYKRNITTSQFVEDVIRRRLAAANGKHVF